MAKCRGIGGLAKALDGSGVDYESFEPGEVEIAGDLASWPRSLADTWPLLAVAGKAPLPSLVVKPSSPEEAALVVDLASKAGACIIPRCGGSNVVGAALPGRCCAVLDLSRLDKVKNVDSESRVAVAEAGAVIADVEAEARRHGLTTALRPQSEDIACIAGLVSMMGSGAYTPGYGNVEDVVQWVEAAIPGLGVVRLGSARNPRGRIGPGVWALLHGSEGSLGVILTVGLRLRDAPASIEARAFRFDSFDKALRVAEKLVQWNPPLTLRVLDEAEASLHGLKGAVMLLEYAGDPEVAEALASWAARVAGSLGGEDLGPEPVREWWESRSRYREYSKMVVESGMAYDTIDLAASWPSLRTLHELVAKRLSQTQGVAYHFSHASHFYPGGGSLYVTVVMERSHTTYWRVWRTVIEAAREAGASIVHHHGFGALRLAWAKSELEGSLKLYCAIKKALDPAGILSPSGLAGLCRCEGSL